MKPGGEEKIVQDLQVLKIQCILEFSFGQIICIVLKSFVHKLPRGVGGGLLVFLLNKTLGPLSCIFNFILEWTVVVSPEELQ